jgi:hypothetical protein
MEWTEKQKKAASIRAKARWAEKKEIVPPAADPVNSPTHYTSHPSGIECIQITEHMGFNLGNALKYIWRCDLKQDAIEDLHKAVWYIQREIMKRMKEQINADNHQVKTAA